MNQDPSRTRLPQTSAGFARLAGATGIGFGFFAGTGVSGLAMMLVLAGLAAAWLGLRVSGQPLRAALRQTWARHWAFWLCWVAWFFWTCVTANWSLAPELGGETVRRLSTLMVLAPLAVWGIVAGGRANRDLTQRGLIAGFLLSLCILGFEAVTAYALNHVGSPGKEVKAIAGDMGRAACATLPLLWVALAAMKEQKLAQIVGVATILLAATVSLMFDTDLNAVGVAGAVVIATLTFWFPRTGLTLVTAGAVILIVTAPVLYPALADLATRLSPGGELPLSYGRRAQMWHVAADLIAQKPLTGWGLGSASTFDRQIMFGGYPWPLIQLHPHAAPLHIWLETGAVGAILAALTCTLAGFSASRVLARNPIALSALTAGLAFLALNWGFSHSAWREWVWTSLAVLIGFAMTLSPPLLQHDGDGDGDGDDDD